MPSTTENHPRDWPGRLVPYWIDDADVLRVDVKEDERPGRDSLGNAGHVTRTTQCGALGVQWTRGRIVRYLEGAGLQTLRDVQGQSEMHRAPVEQAPEEVDPFLVEDSLNVLVRGRDFPGQQRAVLEAKVEALRRELEDGTTDPSRRDSIANMLRSMEDGLRSTVELRAVRRRFKPAVTVREPIESLGTVLAVRPGSRLVYRVNSIDQEAGEEGEPDPMVFHVVALGKREAVLLYTGGVHGLRHLRDLDQSAIHDAWFANRERCRTEATAPWIGRGVYRDLVECGASEVIIHRRRDPEPVALEKIGEDVSVVRVDGRPMEVPVIRCRTSRDDDLIILADEANPLVLRLEESGADLVRTIDDIRSAPGHAINLPGETEMERALEEARRRLDASMPEMA